MINIRLFFQPFCLLTKTEIQHPIYIDTSSERQRDKEKEPNWTIQREFSRLSLSFKNKQRLALLCLVLRIFRNKLTSISASHEFFVSLSKHWTTSIKSSNSIRLVPNEFLYRFTNEMQHKVIFTIFVSIRE